MLIIQVCVVSRLQSTSAAHKFTLPVSNVCVYVCVYVCMCVCVCDDLMICM